MTVELRRRTCANRPPVGDCRRWARNDDLFCCDECRVHWRANLERKWVGGSLVRNTETEPADKQIGATRFPRENSNKGDGLE